MLDRDTLARRRLDARTATTAAELAAGGLLIVMGIARRGLMGSVMRAAGMMLTLQGVSKIPKVRETLGLDDGITPSALMHDAIRAESAVDVDRPREDLYRAWRDLENLPAFMTNLLSVRETTPTRSHWVAKAPAGTVVNFDAEIINEIENELIAWQTVEGSSVRHSGSVHFEPLEGDRTRVRVVLRYDPPAHRFGAAVATLLGKDPQAEIDEDLKRFKEIMETGRVAPVSNEGAQVI